MLRYLVTGATGFIGQRLARSIRGMGSRCDTLVRNDGLSPLDAPEILAQACEGIDCVVHCAGYAHALQSNRPENAALHWRTNFEGTRNLAEAASRCGVRRFVFLSTVKAMADPGAACVDEEFAGSPLTAYGQSKLAAERAVLEAGAKHGMQVVNLRLTMVYGAGGHGNLERMGRLVRAGWFPPLPETGNHRSMVHADDVVSAIHAAATHAAASGHTFIITGPAAPSGRQLFDAMRAVLGYPPMRWAVPETVLRLTAGLGTLIANAGVPFPFNSEVLERLLGSAWYSGECIAHQLGWRPRIGLHAGLHEMFGIPVSLAWIPPR